MPDRPTADTFFATSWCRIAYDRELACWADYALPAARKSVTDPQHGKWLRCAGTWFAGVNALPNDGDGALAGGPPLQGAALDFIADTLQLSGFAWDRAQVSVIYPHYPRQMDEESDAAFGYRVQRDAAHVDGMIPEGPARRRHLRQHHAFLLGIPLLRASADAAPFVVWEGSHKIIRARLRAFFGAIPPSDWGDVDATAAYVDARAAVFDHCRRVEVCAQPGEAYVVHRLAVHGMARWGEHASADSDGRMIAYFRPEMARPEEWLDAP